MALRCALVACAVVAAGCGFGRPRLDAIAEAYVRATLKLSQHDASLVEGWRGPEAWTPGPRRPVPELEGEVDALLQQIADAEREVTAVRDRARITYLSGQSRALRFALDRQLGHTASIDEQARDEFNVTFPPLDQAAIARVHERLNEVLPGPAPLAERVAELRRSTTVRRERRLQTLTAAVAACRAALPPSVPLPPSDRVELRFRDGLKWDAFLRYDGNATSELAIDDDMELDASRALRLACHEAYPGHHVQHLLIDRLYDEYAWPELLLAPGFGPHLFYLEGAAEVAADLALSATQRERLYREELFPVADIGPGQSAALVQVEEWLQELHPVVTDVARLYLDGGITQDTALERLRTEALVVDPRGTLSLIERRRARALVRGEGRRAVYDHLPTRTLEGLHAAFMAAAALQ